MIRNVFCWTIIACVSSLLAVGCSSTTGQKTGSDAGNADGSGKASAMEVPVGSFAPIFNGEDLSNWEGEDFYWSVENGAIVGEVTKGNEPSKDQFLVWTGGKPADFELKLEFTIKNYNGGIQFRSERSEYGAPLAGYQADIDRAGSWLGACFEEGGAGLITKRGNKVKLTRFGSTKHLGRIGPGDQSFINDFNANGWNTYHVVAKGNHLIYRINGHKITEVMDGREDAPKQGLLALQMKGGNPMKIKFRKIRLKRLESNPGSVTGDTK